MLDFLKPGDEDSDFISCWFEHSHVCQNNQRLSWLAEHGPDPEFWHSSVLHWNWDDDPKILDWIIRQPACDAATASWVLIFGNGGRLWRTREEAGRGCYEQFDLFSEVAERWRQGFYVGREFGFGREHASNFALAVRLYLEECGRLGDPPLWRLPDAAFGPFTGRLAAEDYDIYFQDGTLRMNMKKWYDEYYNNYRQA